MGFLNDLRYFGPALGPGRALRLAAGKAGKALAKRRLARELARDEGDTGRVVRLGLPRNAAERVAFLRQTWRTLHALGVSAGEVSSLTSECVLADAKSVHAGRQMLFGRELDVGWPPRWDWRWDGTGNETIFARDVRSTWELQRLQGLLPLARAAHLRPDDETDWGRLYLDALRGFARVEPGPRGVAWESALELGLRLVALAQGLPLVVNGPAWEAAELDVLRILDRHARWLRADLSLDKVVRGNHLLGELAGLVAVGHLIPSARAGWWAGLDAQAILEEEILRQFHPDGVSVEQSISYELFVLQFLLVAARAAAQRERPFAPETQERLRRALLHLATVTAPDGSLPLVGDCDSGRGADFAGADPLDPVPTQERGRELLGEIGSPPPATSVDVRRFPDGGHLVLRVPGGGQLLMRTGPFGWGERGPASHSHADLLCPVLHVGGEPLLVDSGVFGYGIEPALRNRDRGMGAHNGIELEAGPGPWPGGTFRWNGLPLQTGPIGAEETLGGEIRWPEAGLVWQRVVSYNDLGLIWSIQDRIQGARSTRVRWAFHFAPGSGLTLNDQTGVAGIRTAGGLVMNFRFDPPGVLEIGEAGTAPGYGRRVQIPILYRTLDDVGDDLQSRLEIGPVAQGDDGS